MTIAKYSALFFILTLLAAQPQALAFSPASTADSSEVKSTEQSNPHLGRFERSLARVQPLLDQGLGARSRRSIQSATRPRPDLTDGERREAAAGG
jgi:hypothetical protein